MSDKMKVLIVGIPTDKHVASMVKAMKAMKAMPDISVVDISTKEKLAEELEKQGLKLIENTMEIKIYDKCEVPYLPQAEKTYDHKINKGKWR